MSAVRRAVPGDERIVRDVRLRAVEESPVDFASDLREVAWSLGTWREWTERGATFLLEEDGGAGGLVCCVPHATEPPARFLESMWVAPARRGTGAADRLLETARTWAEAHGFATLWLHVVGANGRARRFYERNGFRDTGERATFRDGVVEVEMRREVGRRLRLVEPTRDLAAAFLDMAAEWRAAGQRAWGYEEALRDLDRYLASLAKQRAGVDLRPDRVPSLVFWLVDGDRVVATSRLRTRLLPHLEKEGGHIGYDVRPTERRKGYATAVLRRTLEAARALGLDGVLVTCDHDNVGSGRTIRNVGGELLGQVVSDRTGKLVDRYRVRT